MQVGVLIQKYTNIFNITFYKLHYLIYAYICFQCYLNYIIGINLFELFLYKFWFWRFQSSRQNQCFGPVMTVDE